MLRKEGRHETKVFRASPELDRNSIAAVALFSLRPRSGAEAEGLHRRRGAGLARAWGKRFHQRQLQPGYLDMEERSAHLLRTADRSDANAADIRQLRDGR